MQLIFNTINLLMRLMQRMPRCWLQCFLLFFLLSQVQVTYAVSGGYVVNLMAMKKNIDLNAVKNIADLKRRYNVIVYSKSTVAGKKHILSVGYFLNYQKAKNAAIKLGKSYPGAYPVKFVSNYTVVKSSKQLSSSRSATKSVALSRSTSAKAAASNGRSSSLGKKQLDKMMNSAKSSIKKEEYKRAVQLFSAILSVTENEYSEEALELLGVARERNDQYNHAVKVYNQYIKKYPGTKGTRRVKQRLAVLTTATKRVGKQGRKKLKLRARPWRMAGSLSQSYNNTNGDDADLYTFLSLSGRKKNEGTDLRLKFTGSRTTPIKGQTDTDFQISEIYADVLFRDSHFSTKIGRQRSRSGGLFGRLDGVLLSYDNSGSARYNIFSGIPVENSRDALFDTEKNKKIAYGINTDLTFFGKALDLNLYALVQKNNNILDRQVVGAEVRFFKKSISVFSLLDYDTDYGEVNIFLLNGNWKPANKYNFFINADYRKNPLLTTANALIGQTETDLGTLVSVLGEDAVRQLALDRSTTSQLVSIGLLGPWSEATTIRGDISTTTISESNATVASAGIDAVPATPMVGPDYYYSLQFVTKNYFSEGDTTILQFQYSDTVTSQKFSSLFNTRIPITKKLRMTPRLILSFNDFELGQNRTDLRTSIRTDYKYGRRLHMDADIGMDLSSAKGADGSAVTNYYFIASYHWIF